MIDLSQYEDAATLNRWFINNYPLGRIDLDIASLDLVKGIVVFKGSVWRDINDVQPAISNYAKGERDDYPAHMRKWYLEDTATSCIARCLTLLKGSNKTAPKESMVRATAWAVEPKAELDKALESSPVSDVSPVSLVAGVQGSDLMREQICATGSRMRFKEGISKTTQKPFKGYVCECGQGCPAVWASLSANGTWYFKEAVNG